MTNRNEIEPGIFVEDVATLHEQVLGVRVTRAEWVPTLNGQAISKDDVPGPLRSLAKETARSIAYEAGFYTFDAPSVATTSWTQADWMRYVTYTTADV